MQSFKPYLIRALHEWCVDQGYTPYISVAVDAITRVPQEYVKNGEIVFNIGLEATHQLQLGNDDITFQGRFGGRVFPVIVPIARVAAIYAKENGEGMTFEVTNSTLPAIEKPLPSASTAEISGEPEVESEQSSPDAVSPAPTISSSATPARPAGRPTLTRIK
jgi:stringent starvation protein B